MLKSVFRFTGLTLLGAAAFALGCEGEDGASAPTGESVLKLVACGTSANEIKGCVAKTGGALRVIGGRTSCALTETTLCWSQTGPQGANSLTAVTPLLAGDATCPAGGSLLSVGTDTDADAALEPTEVDATAAVCNGKNSLVRVTDEFAGGNCPNGGQRIETGLDDDGDGVLDYDEVDAAATEYLCTPCPEGFTGSTAGCIDVNECAAGTHDCHFFATCTNLEGGYECDCAPGFDGDGSSCIYDIFTGSWSGTTSEARPISMRVEDGVIQSISIGTSCSPMGSVTYSALNHEIASSGETQGNFSVSSNGTVSAGVSGFLSRAYGSTPASGDGSFSVSTPLGCAASGTWEMTRFAACGDLVISAPETCEDYNLNDEDSCVHCRPGAVESEPNDDGSVAINTGDFSALNAEGPIASTTIYRAAISPAGDEDVYAIMNTRAEPVNVRLETFGGVTGQCAPEDDTVITMRNAAGGTLTTANDGGIYSCSLLPSYTIPAGQTVYAHVSHNGDWLPIPRYFLQVDFL